MKIHPYALYFCILAPGFFITWAMADDIQQSKQVALSANKILKLAESTLEEIRDQSGMMRREAEAREARLDKLDSDMVGLNSSMNNYKQLIKDVYFSIKYPDVE